MAISTNGTIITRLAGALYNEYLSNASYTELNTTPAATVAANMLSSDFAGKTDLQIATTVLSNLGLSAVAGLNNWVAAQLTAAGSTAAAKGAKLVSMLNDFAMMTADATYGSYATTFNSNTAAGLTSSQTAKSAGGAFATAGAVAAAAAAAEAKAAADAKAAAEKAVADKAAADAAAAEKAIADKAAADKAAADKVIADAEAAAKAPQSFNLTTAVDTGATFTGKDGADTYTATTQTPATGGSLQTLTAGDNLNGGLGADTLNITNTAAATLGAGVTVSSIETVNVTATAATTVDTTGFTGVTTIGNVGSTSDIIVNGLKAIPAVSVTGTSSDTTLAVATTAVVGASDAITVTVNGVATSSTADDALISVNGIETINVVAAGSASGSSASTVNFASDAPVSFNVSGTTAKVGVTLGGASAAVTGVVTSDAGAHDINLTNFASTSKLSADLGAGNDTLRVGSIAATHTIAGGEGTDTLNYSANTAVVPALTANVTGFESVTLSHAAPASFGLAGVSTVTYTSAAGGTYSGLATGGTLNLDRGGAATLAATYSATSTTANAYTGAADSLTVNVGKTTTATGTTITNATVSSSGIESVTINNLAAASNLDTRTVGIIDSTATTGSTTSLTVTGAQATTVTASGTAALKTVNLSGITSGATFAGTVSTTGATITGGAGNDVLNGGTGADNIVGGAGNDNIDGKAGADTIDAGDGTNTITGGTGADVLTGGSGVDTYVFASNATTAATPVATSTSSASDTITNFVSGTDKISITGTHAPQAFLGNFPNIQTALAAAGAAGTLAYSAAFVTGESSLYVFKNTNGTLDADDMVIKLTNVTALATNGSDLLLGSQAAGATITLSATAVAGQTGATSGTQVDGVASTTANLTAGNDTVTSTIANLIGSTVTAGVGSDTLALSITAAATNANTAENTLSANNLAAVTGFETITLANFANTTLINNDYSITIADVNVADNSTLTVTSSHAGLQADGNLRTAGVTFTASGLTGNRKLNFTGGTAHDVVVGGAGNDTLVGSDGNDTITGGAGVNNLNGGAGNDTIIINAAHASTAANVLAGSTGVADTLQIGTGTNALTVDLSGSTISGFENLDLATNVAVNALTLTGAQYAAFTGTVSGDNADDTITLTTVPAASVATGNTVGNFSFVEGTTFSVGTTNTAVVVTETGTVGTVSTAVLGAATYSGTWVGWDASDVVSLPATGTVTAPALTAAAFNFNNGTSTLVLTKAIHDASTFTAAGTTTGTQTVSIATGTFTTLAAAAGIDAYIVADAGAGNALAISGVTGAVGINAVSATDAVTVSVSGTYTGTLTGQATAADVVSVATGTNIAGATVSTGFVGLTIATGGTVTMTAAQYSAFTGTTTAAGTTANTPETIVLTTAGSLTTSATIDSAVETITLANGTNTITLAGTTGHTINGGTGADTINITAATDAKNFTIDFGVDALTDRVFITNAAVDPAHVNVATVSNFNVANDAIKTTLDTTVVSGGPFLSLVAGSNTAIVAANTINGSVIEITGTNLANLADDGDGLTVEAAILAALGTLTITADTTYTVVMYGGGNAGVYQVTLLGTEVGGTANDVDIAADFSVEHVATIVGIAADSLGSANFYG